MTVAARRWLFLAAIVVLLLPVWRMAQALPAFGHPTSPYVSSVTATEDSYSLTVKAVNGDELTVENDLTGFIGKDVEKIYTFIQENVTEWTPIA